ncbi:MAG: site-2 protease family protein [Verrucomicrobiales bacterium]|nr:site-2 protease family protein [Verrucomicrobiales bacterium]
MSVFAALPVSVIFDGLLTYVCLIILLTFHEFAHAWTASRCGDDTAKDLGRVSLNPIVHMEVLGTVVLPLLVVFLGAVDSKMANFIIGWGKPVPVNPSNLRRRRADGTLVALAGPAMNLLLAVGLMALARVFDLAGQPGMVEVAIRMTVISLVLCFFNLLPIPPLDGSHVVKNLIGMREETYAQLCRYGLLMVIVALQIPPVRGFITGATLATLGAIARGVGLV